MNKVNYQNQQIIEYLLGSMPAAEAEKFDELSLTNDEFVGALDAAEKDLLDGYVRGELGGATLEKFKSHYLASPLRREKVSFAKTLQIYAEKKSVQTAKNQIFAEETNKQPKSNAFFSPLNFFRNLNSARQWSFVAAALLVAALGGFWIFSQRSSNGGEIAKQTLPSNLAPPKQIEERQTENSHVEKPSAVSAPPENKIPADESEKKPPPNEANRQPARTPEPKQRPAPEKSITSPVISVAAFILTPSMRGGRVENLSIPKNTTDVNVSLELETDDFAHYRVALTDESGAVNLWRGGKTSAVKKGENKYLIARFPAKLLKSKIYLLTVSGVNPNGAAEIISSYPFRVMLK